METQRPVRRIAGSDIFRHGASMEVALITSCLIRRIESLLVFEKEEVSVTVFVSYSVHVIAVSVLRFIIGL